MLAAKIHSLMPIEHITRAILVLRGHKVLLDTELATLYGVTTKRFNEQVRRNRERFPEEVKRVAALGDKAALKALSQWRRKVGQGSAGTPPEGPWSGGLRDAFAGWRAQVEAREALHGRLAQALAQEEPQVAARLRELVLRPDVREAVFLLVPALLEAIDGMKATALADRRAAERALERRLYAFVQRLGSKNETTSFFGPLTHAQVDPTVTGFSFGPELPGGFVRREFAERQRGGFRAHGLQHGDLLGRRVDAERLRRDLDHQSVAHLRADGACRLFVGVGIQ